MPTLTDGVIELIEVNPAQAQLLAEGTSPLPAVDDYPHTDSAAAARLMRDGLGIDNWVPGFGMHLIRRVADKLVVGDVGFRTPPDERGVVEIGYGLAASARGQGLVSRAVRLLATNALARSGVSAIIADTTLDNPASIHVLEAVGFTHVRTSGNDVRYRLLTPPTPQPELSAQEPPRKTPAQEPPPGVPAQNPQSKASTPGPLSAATSPQPQPEHTASGTARAVPGATETANPPSAGRADEPLVVIVVFAPLDAADNVRRALASAGAGRIGEYSACSFSAPGQGRFLPGQAARPHIGEPGHLEVVDEVRIECVCPAAGARAAAAAMLAAHPYEEPAWHCYRALTLADL